MTGWERTMTLVIASQSFQHPRLLRIGENPARLDDRQHVAQGTEVVALASGFVQQVAVVEVDFQLVASAYLLDEAVLGFQGNEVTAVDGVAEEDAGVELGDDALDAGLGEGERGVLAAGAAAEVFAADDDLVIAAELVLADEADAALRQAGLCLGHAAVGVHAEE